MSDLDLTHVLASAGPGNFDWLDVDEREYRALDRLPEQNLDIVPELKAQWSHENRDPLAYFVPNRDLAAYPEDPRIPVAPHTMGDLSQAHGPIHEDSPLLRVARFALMQSTDPRQWQEALTSRFSRNEITTHREALTHLLDERGLLGRLYVAASDFPACAEGTEAAAFVRRYASEAKFVLEKQACGECCHKQTTLSGAGRCGIFHKELVPQVPYTDALAQQVETDQAARGVQASALGEPRERIKAAFLQPAATRASEFSGQVNAGGLIPASRLLRAPTNVAAEERVVQAAKARPVVATLKRELLKGRSVDEIAHGLRLAFDIRDLKATKDHWAPLIKEAGLYGVVYSTQDSFDDCREGADFLSKHGSKVRAIVAGDKCESCIYSKVGRCLMYGRKLVASAEDLYTPETITAVLDEHRATGAIALTAANWGSTPRQALQNIHRLASTPKATALDTARMTVQRAFHGLRQEHATGDLTRREVLRTASKLMNEGLYGDDLRTLLQSKFDPRDLVGSATELRSLVAENQGLMGIYFVDPTVYDDYGKGCKEAQRLHRTRQAVSYARVGEKCATCVHQTQPGVCSVLNKKLAKEPPYQDKRAQQRAILASGSSTSLDYASLVNNGMTMLQEFELKGSGNLELNPVGESFDASIQFGNNDVNLAGL
jgi:hypothetical protein